MKNVKYKSNIQHVSYAQMITSLVPGAFIVIAAVNNLIECWSSGSALR